MRTSKRAHINLPVYNALGMQVLQAQKQLNKNSPYLHQSMKVRTAYYDYNYNWREIISTANEPASHPVDAFCAQAESASHHYHSTPWWYATLDFCPGNVHPVSVNRQMRPGVRIEGTYVGGASINNRNIPGDTTDIPNQAI